MSDTDYVSNPYIICERNDKDCLFINPFYNSKSTLPLEAGEIYDYCNNSKELSDISKNSFFNDEVFVFMVENFIILKYDELNYTSKGFLVRPNGKIGHFYNWKANKEIENALIIFGAPSDLAGANNGAKAGPSMIRDAFKIYQETIIQANNKDGRIYDFEFRREYNINNLKLYDVGDIYFNHSEEVQLFGSRISKLMREVLSSNGIPIMLGGDHSLSYYTIKELKSKYKEYGIIHFDAHHDTYVNSFVQRNSLSHGNPFAHLLKDNELVSLLQVGLRTVDYISNHTRKTRDSRVTYLSSYEAHTMQPEQLFKNLSKNIPYYLSFDVDCLMPEVVSSTATPVAGGLTYYQVLAFIDYLTLNFKIIGFDFVELLDDKTFVGKNIIAKLISVIIFNSLSNKDFFNND